MFSEMGGLSAAAAVALNSTRFTSGRIFANQVTRSCMPFGIFFDFGLPQLIAREIARMSFWSAKIFNPLRTTRLMRA